MAVAPKKATGAKKGVKGKAPSGPAAKAAPKPKALPVTSSFSSSDSDSEEEERRPAKVVAKDEGRPAKKAKGAAGEAVTDKKGAGEKGAGKGKGGKGKDVEGDAAGKKRKRDEAEEEKKPSEDDGNASLDKFRISEATKEKLIAAGITSLFPIQAATFDHVMDGKDLIARARTGTGKTLSFVLPVHEMMLDLKKSKELSTARGRGPACIVLSPTRELARQITKVFETVAAGSFTVLSVYGGTPYADQERPLQSGVDIVVGTPGRVIDLFDRQKLNLSQIRFFVLDEADEMLNVGFKDSVDKLFEAINEKKAERNYELQTLLFSATVPEWITSLTKKFFRDEQVNVDLVRGQAGTTTATKINHLCIPCPWSSRARTIGDIVLCYAGQHGRTIIFTETKKEANELALDDAIKQDCAVLHGDIAQAQRETTFQAFREGKFRCLVATDVCARGLDIPEIDLVLMCHPTKDADTYVHRSGRTGRAGRSGTAVTFYTPRELGLLRAIERRIATKMKVISAPQPADIIKANARDIKTSIEGVHADVLPLFDSVAEEMIAELGPVKALASALAVIAGQTQPLPARSMLTSLEGYKTFILRVENGVPETRNVFGILRTVMPQEFVSSIRQIRLFQGTPALGAAFDVPVDKVGVFVEAECPRGAEALEEVHSVDDLPDLQDPPQLNNRQGFGSGSPGGNSWQQRSPHGNNRSFGSPDSRGPRTPGGGADVNERKVFVGGLPMDAMEKDIVGLFNSIGKVDRVTMLQDAELGTFKGVAFVTLGTKEEAEKACSSLNATKHKNRNLRVNMAASKRQ